MSKKLLLIQGWGLHRDPFLENIFRSKGYTVDRYDLDNSEIDVPNLKTYNGVLIHGPFSSVLSDILLTAKHAQTFKMLFESQHPCKIRSTKFFAFGKGAFVLMQTGLWGSFDLTQLGIASKSLGNLWKKVTLQPRDHKKISALQICESPWDPHSSFFEKFTPWAYSEGISCAWLASNNLYFSDVDILALKESSSLPDYGYFDSTTISTSEDFLDKLIL